MQQQSLCCNVALRHLLRYHLHLHHPSPDMDGQGLGCLFTDMPIKYCKARSVKMMNCHALTDNQAMLSVA
eukprot:3610047-Amphidinium_carterae.1